MLFEFEFCSHRTVVASSRFACAMMWVPVTCCVNQPHPLCKCKYSVGIFTTLVLILSASYALIVPQVICVLRTVPWSIPRSETTCAGLSQYCTPLVCVPKIQAVLINQNQKPDCTAECHQVPKICPDFMFLLISCFDQSKCQGDSMSPMEKPTPANQISKALACWKRCSPM